jgi:hypothetical protein
LYYNIFILPVRLKVDVCSGYSIEDVKVQYLGLNLKYMDLEESDEVRFFHYIWHGEVLVD